MDNKKSLIISMVGVLTLVTAVIGATYAFFSVTGTGQSASSSTQTETANVGVVTLNDSGIDFYLNLMVIYS